MATHDESAGFSSQSVWSGDGRTVYFSNADGSLLAKDARGLSKTRTLLGGGVANQYACSAAPDGSALAVQSQQSATGWDLGIVPLAGEAKLKPFLTTPANEREARFSPDGKWLAYLSDESGRNELYLVPYPGPGGKWQISPAGAEEGVWLSATELGFWQDRKLFAVTLRFDEGGLTVDPPRRDPGARLPSVAVTPRPAARPLAAAMRRPASHPPWREGASTSRG